MKNKNRSFSDKVSIKAVKIVFDICKSDCVKMVVVQIIISLFPLVIGITIQNMINNINKIDMMQAFFYSAIYIIIYFLQKVFRIFFHNYYIVYKIMPNFERQVKLKLFGYTEVMTIEDFDDAEIANEAIRAKNASVNLFRIFQAYVEVIGTIISCLIICFAGLFICWQMVTFFAIIVISVIFENLNRIKVETEDFYEKTQADKVYEENVDFLFNPQKFKEVKVFRLFDYVFLHISKCWSVLYEKKRRKNIKILKITLFFGIISCVAKICAFILLFISYKNGSINLGSIAFAMISFLSISDMIDDIFNVQSYISQFSNLVIPYFEYQKKAKSQNENHFDDVIEQIELKNVSYRYKNQTQNAISNINMRINTGDKIIIVGENGSGKSTLVKLIGGLIKPKSGKVLYNGKESEEYKEYDILQSFTKVPQSINLYPISLIENITFGALGSAMNICDEFSRLGLENIYHKRNLIVGKTFGGEEYSGGEKQKIGIIRAKNRDANCIVLDEATSAIDAIQEDEIFDRLCVYLRDKMGIIVSHKLTYAKTASRIIVLQNGEIIEEGLHEDLLIGDGLYKKMWETQTKGYQD